LSTACDAAGDWTTSYDTPKTQVRAFAIDTTNGVLYAATGDAGGDGFVYRCALSTACDAAGDWTTSFDPGSYGGFPVLAIDTTGGVLYTTYGGNVYRCAV